MDKVNDVGGILSSIGVLDSKVNSVVNALDELDTLKSNMAAAWESENSVAFMQSYSDLKSAISSFTTSLSAYKSKLENVVNQFKKFDEAVTKGDN